MDRRGFMRYLPLWSVGIGVTFKSVISGLFSSRMGAGSRHIRMIGDDAQAAAQEAQRSLLECSAGNLTSPPTDGCGTPQTVEWGETCTDAISWNLCRTRPPPMFPSPTPWSGCVNSSWIISLSSPVPMTTPSSDSSSGEASTGL